jgi:RNA polymerase sigma factor (sigma-70 family)
LKIIDLNHAIAVFTESKDTFAFKFIYENLSQRMYYICLRYLKNEPDAQDVLQESFIKIFKQSDSYSGKGSFEGWVRRIVVNNCLQLLMKNKKTLFDNADIERQGDFEDQDGLNTEDIELQEKQLLEAFNLLPDNYRTILNLAVIENYSHKEIGGILNISENTSRIQLLRARNLLKSKLMYHAVR